LLWLQIPSKINGHILNTKPETSRHFRNKKWQYLKDKIDELATNSKKIELETCIEESIHLRGVTYLESKV
jgi:hypothetical protein